MLNQSDRFTTVHLMNTMGRHLTLEQNQSSSMKQTVLAQNTVFKLIDSADIYGKVLSIVYSKRSKFTVSWDAAVSRIKRCKFQIERLGIKTGKWICNAKDSLMTA